MTPGATARLFVAIDPPPAVRTELALWGRAAAATARRSGGELRLLGPELLHVTLCFLGSVQTAKIAALGDAVLTAGEGAAPVGELFLGAPLWLPPRRPRALAVELRDDAESSLEALQETVTRALQAACDFHREHRRFRPHITVARMRQGAAPRERGLPATPSLAFVPETLVLYRSWLSPTGARYEALASQPLPAR
jgi:RNA 2',3'-cyclic 3'-phosphodiesterase